MRIRGFAPSTPCWVELTVADRDRAADFYAELFGWKIDGDRFLLNGCAVAGISPLGTDRPQGWLAYFAAPDPQESVERVLAANGKCLTPPQERLGAKTAIVADAVGATFGLWQAAGFAGAQLREEPNAMAWSDLLTDDVAAATTFYGSVFGWKLTTEFGSGEWLTESHDSVAGLVTERPGPRWQPSFQVADCAAAVQRFTELGAMVAAGPLEMGLGSYVEMVDPFGAIFAITAPVPRPVELTVTYHEVAGMELTYRGQPSH